MKKIFLGISIGLLISGITVYAANLIAGDISYTTEKNSNVKNVSDALNDLYANIDNKDLPIIDVDMFVNKEVNLNLKEGYTYENSNQNIITVDLVGNITSKSSGEAFVTVKNNDIEVIKYRITVLEEPFEILDGKACYYLGNSSCGDKILFPQKVKDALTDNIHAKQGGQGALLLRPGSYISFKVNYKIKMSFASNNYSDNGGYSGKDALFYKVNSDGTKTLYYTLTQLNDTQNYGEYIFEPGEYYLSPSGYYVEFDEWIVSKVY